jgi:hypothetical protein
MEAVLLDLVLSGVVDVDHILPWTLCEGSALPQSVAARLSEHPEAQWERPPQAAHFREAVFNTVRPVSHILTHPPSLYPSLCRVFPGGSFAGMLPPMKGLPADVSSSCHA